MANRKPVDLLEQFIRGAFDTLNAVEADGACDAVALAALLLTHRQADAWARDHGLPGAPAVAGTPLQLLFICWRQSGQPGTWAGTILGAQGLDPNTLDVTARVV